MRVLFLLLLLSLPIGSKARADELLDRPVRGLSTMHCFASAAQCKALCDILFDARLKHNAINFIADGTFGFSASSFRYCVDRLTSEGRTLHVLIYAHSGPGARRYVEYKKQHVPGWASGISPALINRRIVLDSKFKADYQSHVSARVKPLVEYVLASGAHPMVGWLEDNFNAPAFVWFYVLTAQVLQGLDVEYVRNALHPASAFIPPGVTKEIHVLDPGLTLTGGVVFNDGEGFKFLHEKPSDFEATMVDVAETQRRAGELGNIFILWSGQYQGNNGKSIIHPLKRVYRMPREDERAELIKVLRGGG